MARAIGIPAACVAALALRLSFVLVHDPYRHADLTDYSDYLRQADHLLSRSSGPEDTFMPMGLPGWIALGKLLHLPRAWLPLWQVAVGVVTVAAVGLAVRRLTSSNRAATFAAWVAALYPAFLYYQAFLFTETTTAALVAVAILLAASGLQRRRDQVLLGLVLGIAGVWRTNVPLVPVIWAAGSLVVRGPGAWLRGPHPRVLAWAAAPVALMALRASLLVGAPTGPSTNGGVDFLLAHSRWTEVHMPFGAPGGGTRIVHFFRSKRLAQENVYRATSPVFREKPLYDEAWRSISSEPGRELGHLVDAALDGAGLGDEGYYPKALWYDRWLDADVWMERTKGPVGLLIVLPAVAWAIWRVRSRRRPIEAGEGFLVAAIVTGVLTPALYLPEPRMRVPFDPAYIVAGTLAWTAAARWLVARLRSPQPAAYWPS